MGIHPSNYNYSNRSSQEQFNIHYNPINNNYDNKNIYNNPQNNNNGNSNTPSGERLRMAANSILR